MPIESASCVLGIAPMPTKTISAEILSPDSKETELMSLFSACKLLTLALQIISTPFLV